MTISERHPKPLHVVHNRGPMSKPDIDPVSRSRVSLPRRQDLTIRGQEFFDYFTSGTKHVLRGLHGPAGLWLHNPSLVEVYLPFGRYLRFEAGLDEAVREVCILATARECDTAFEWAAHEPEALRVGVPEDVVGAIKFREDVSTIPAPYGTVVALIREALTEHAVSSNTYTAAIALFGVPRLIDLITLAGTYASTAALLAVFDMQLDDGETHLLPPLERDSGVKSG
jgi:4-carboxymuconolactone decarboxylase